MIAAVSSLGMYDHPAQRAANDRLWAAIVEALREGGVVGIPDRLDRSRDVHALWRDPGLVFGQACGFPLVSDPTLDLQILALPVYAVAGCEGPTHRSVIVCHGDDVRTSLADFHAGRAAINDVRSNTGMNLFRAAIARVSSKAPFFDTVVETGSHRQSAVAVGNGAADIAAIDCVTYAALEAFEPDLVAPLRVVALSPTSPTLPFVTAAITGEDMVAALRAALDRVIADPALAAARAALFLTGVAPAGADALARIVALETAAVDAGHAALA